MLLASEDIKQNERTNEGALIPPWPRGHGTARSVSPRNTQVATLDKASATLICWGAFGAERNCGQNSLRRLRKNTFP